MRKSLLIVGFLGVVSVIVPCVNGFGLEGLDSAAAKSLKREFPKLEFQSIRQTGVGGLYEVVAGMNVLYYDPKSGVILFGELFSKEWKNQTALERSRLLAAAFKDGQFDKAARSPVEGLYEVVSGQTVIYFDPKSGARLIGDMYSKEGKNLTSEVRDKAAAQAVLKELPLDRAIKIGKGKNTVIMFTDPDCPYCRKIEDYFRGRKDVTRYVYLFPLEQIHPKSLDKAKIILCSKDRAKAFLDAMGGSLDEGELKPCPDEKVAASLNENISLAQKIGIQGTPYLIVNGVAVRGADTNRIDALLAEGSKK